MREAVICEPVRTPIGRYGGVFASLTAVDRPRSGVTMHDSLARARSTAGGRNHPLPGGMLETAENLRREYTISHEEQDALAVRSHQRAVAAQQSGVLATLARELQRREARYGLETMCIGGGQGLAAVFERVA